MIIKRLRGSFYLILMVFLLFSTQLTVYAGDPTDPRQEPTAIGDAGAVATEHPDASEAAINIMKKGGNAVDAAVAAAAVQSVTRPFSGGLGGGGIMNVYLGEEDKFIILDHRSESSENFGPDAFIDSETGLVLPEATRITSGMATAIPGAVKAWEEAIEKYGNLSLAEVLEPAIRVAEEGFRADENYIRETSENAHRFKRFSSTSEIYLDENGKVPEVGTIMKNPDMAKTFRLIAKHGSKVFYEGEIAEAIIDTIHNPPLVDPENDEVLAGNMTLNDLKNYKVIMNEPTHSTYNGYDIYSTPPSSSGGTTIGEILNILEPYNISTLPYTQAMHYYLESSRLAFADRREYLGDDRYSLIPVKGFLSKGYAAERRQLISDDRAAVGQVSPGNPWPYEEDPDKMPDSPSDDNYVFYYNFEGKDGSPWDSNKFGRIDTGTRTSPNDTEFIIENNTGKIILNERQISRGSAYGRVAPNMQAIKDGELFMKFKFKNLGHDHRARIWMNSDVWGSGSTMPENGYGIEINAKTDQLLLVSRKNGSTNTLDRMDANLTTDWQMIRFRVHNKTLAVKLWNENESEPDRWQIVKKLRESKEFDVDYGKFLFSLINFEYDSKNEFFIDEIIVDDLESEVMDPVEPEEPEIPVDKSFEYDFSDNVNDSWDANKFYTIDEGVAFDLDKEGGRITFKNPPTGYTTSFGKAEPLIDNLKDSELTMRIKGKNIEGNKRLRLWLRANDWKSARSTYANEAIGIEMNTNTNSINITQIVDGTTSVLSSLDADQVSAEEWTWIKLRVEEDTVKLKLWDDKDSEPSEWDLELTNEKITKEGRVLLGIHDLSPNNNGTLHISDFKVKDLDFEKVNTSESSVQEATNDESTIHLSVTDADGNIVSYTTTIVSIGGNGMVVPGYGFLLNNALYGRTPYQSPDHPNYPKPNYRSLSSMSPTIVMKDGQPVMTTGAPGSDTIITTVTEIILNHLDFGMTLPEAIEAPRLSQRNNIDGKAQYEEIHLEKYDTLLSELEEMGHAFKADRRVQGIGSATGIEFLEDGRIRAAAEPVRRGGGSAMALNKEDIERTDEKQREKLADLVQKIKDKQLNEENFTNKSWIALTEAIADAERILADPDATEEKLMEVYKQLLSSYESLKEILPTPEPEVDKSALESKIKEITDMNLDESQYSSDSWEALESALYNANRVLKNDAATQEDVDQALAKLEKTLRNLIQREKSHDEKDEDPTLETEDDFKGSKLPETATQIFNYLLFGVILLLVGLYIYRYRRQHE